MMCYYLNVHFRGQRVKEYITLHGPLNVKHITPQTKSPLLFIKVPLHDSEGEVWEAINARRIG